MGETELVNPEVIHHKGKPIREARNDNVYRYNAEIGNRYRVAGPKTAEFQAMLKYEADRREHGVFRQYYQTHYYINYTNRPIVVVDRAGLPVPVLPDLRKHQFGSPGMVIRKELVFDDDQTAQRAFNELVRFKSIQCSELNKLKALLLENRCTIDGKVIWMEYFLPEHDIDSTPLGIYHIKTDTLIYRQDLGYPISHPFSGQNVGTNFKSGEIYADASKDAQVSVRYVNHHEDAKPLYIQVMNQTLVLYPQAYQQSKLVSRCGKDGTMSKDDAVQLDTYIEMYLPHARDGLEVEYFRCIRVSVEDAKLFYGVCDTAVEAAEATQIREQKIKLLKEQLDDTNRTNKRQAEEHARDLSKEKGKYDILERKYQELQIDHDRLKKDKSDKLESIKNQRDEKLQSAKATSEYVKLGFGLLAGVLSITPLLIKTFGD